MKAIDTLITSLKEYKDNINEYMEDITRSIEDEIKDLNVHQQYDLGQDRNGNMITPGYTPFTISIKRWKGQPTDRVTLQDTGQFHSSFKIRYDEDSFELYANDWKTESLVEKYGNDIFGLHDDAARELADQVYQPRMIQKLKSVLSL
jgi:hypothetical protein